MNKYKYNFIFYQCNEDYLEVFFQPLKKKENVIINKRAFNSSKLIEMLFFLHWSKKINRIFELPLKKIWYSKMFKGRFDNNKPCCYIFVGGKYLLGYPDVYQYIKELNPQNKCAIYYLDKSKLNEKVKNYCDFIVTYDKGEAEKYNILYLENDSYDVIGNVSEPKTFSYDVYYLGFAKDRLNQIHSVYHTLTEHGLKCLFIVCGVKKREQIKEVGVHYQKPISYKENIKNIQKSKCILEIGQSGINATTMRFKEALYYKRKLLTNISDVKNQKHYNKNNISCFSTIEDIDIDFIKNEIDYSSFHQPEDTSDKIVDFFETLCEEN